ncbi:MAG: lysophospholipid acyltransferase family protein [Candidatus Izemoplasmatales bacterium]|nr:lysophospholipid acyltransferase family protein [Candidatus Izemoplasmatales bacterium]
MLAKIQFVISILLTVLYAVNINFTFALIDISKVILVFLVINLILTLLVLFAFVFLIYTTENFKHDSLRKHKMFNFFNEYIFNFLYRVKPIVIEKENLPKNNNFMVYSNHIEYTDPLYVKQVYKNYALAYLSKEELFKYPVLKNILRGTGCIPLSRKVGDRRALQAVLQAIKQVKAGQPLGIFPEGTRSHANIIGEFKSGSFKIAQKAQADISPVVLFNMHKTVDAFKFFKSKVYIKVLPIISYEKFKDMDTNELSALVHDLIEEEKNKLKEVDYEENNYKKST